MSCQLLQFPKSSRDLLIEKHLHLVQLIARVVIRRLPPSFEFDDLVQEGCLGLMTAADTFDESKNVPFQSWARTKIEFAMSDSVRRRNYTANTMEGLQGNAPVCLARVQKSIDYSEEVKRAMNGEAENPEEQLNRSIDQPRRLRIVRRAISELQPRKRSIFEMYYEGNQPLTTAGASLGLHSSRVSQLHQQGLRELTTALERVGVSIEYSELRERLAGKKAA